ncbi:MAG: hypothetical protein AB1846_05660 [Chloroflexota bacterium]
MSKKFKNGRRQPNRTANPLVWMIGGGVLLLAAALFVAFGNRDGGGTPSLAVDRSVIDYGEVKLETNLTFEVTVTNTGDSTLRFKEKPYIEVREGC